MAAHGWMTIQAVRLPVVSGPREEVAEDAMTSQHRSARQHRNEAGLEETPSQINHGADGADSGGEIKGRPLFVMAGGCPHPSQRKKSGFALSPHLTAPKGGCAPRHTNRLQIWIIRELVPG